MSAKATPPRIVWVTGAGKGIGRAVAIALADEGWTVAASARTVADLDELASANAKGDGRILPFPLDITDADAPAATVARIEADLGPIDLAILNAGTHEPTPAVGFDVARARNVIEVNLLGTLACLAAVLPHFIARRRGQIAIVASVAGYRGLPTAAAYAASKAGLIASCESFRPELERAGVKLQLVSPGFVDTPLTRKNDFAMPFLISPEKAAEAFLKGLRSDRFEIVFPRRMAYLMKILRVLPYPLFLAVTRRMARG